MIGKDSSCDAGADVFWKPNSEFQLSATINPDFGQGESDSLVANFSAQETFFGDRRPCFTENQGYFDFNLLSDISQLLYTRRVGAMADDGNGDDFEVNDAGYLGRYDLNYAQFEVGKRITELPADFAYASHNLRFHGNSQRRDGGNLNWNLQLRRPAHDDQITRGNRPLYVRNGGNALIGRGFQRRGNWQFNVEASLGVASGLGQDTPYAWSASVSSTDCISDALNIELWMGHVMDQEQLIWQEHNLVAGFQMNRYDLSASRNWNIGTRHELRVKLEALGFDADNPMPWRIGADGRGVVSNDVVQPFSLHDDEQLLVKLACRFEL